MFSKSVTPGITGLTGNSNQRFDYISPLDAFYKDLETTINLRLVCKKKPTARRLKHRPGGNPVPPPI